MLQPVVVVGEDLIHSPILRPGSDIGASKYWGQGGFALAIISSKSNRSIRRTDVRLPG